MQRPDLNLPLAPHLYPCCCMYRMLLLPPQELNPQNVANLLWSCATLGQHVPTRLLLDLCNSAATSMQASGSGALRGRDAVAGGGRRACLPDG